ncbi:unnamed protein product, partial [Rotaria sp. Silwood2]
IEYETCRKCRLKYTDEDSHLNKCNRQKLTCFQCGEQYQHEIYNNHIKICRLSTNPMINRQPTFHSDSHESINEEDLLFCVFCNMQYSIYEINDHESCFRHKQQDRQVISSSSRISTSSSNGKTV